jgi:chemotaxis methyl-accepting protein methylase
MSPASSPPAAADPAPAAAAPDPRRAARRLAHTRDARALAAWLAREPSPSARAALFEGLVQAEGADCLTPYLGSADPGLRNGAVAALKALGPKAAGALDLALRDPAADVRLLAVEVLRAWPPPLALPRLQRVLLHDEHVNVCAAAAEVAAARGAPALAPALAGLGDRFPDHPFIRFCAHVALTRIGDEAAPDHVLPGAPRDVDLHKFIELFYRHTGVRFADSQFYYLARQLAAQAALHGWDSTAYLAWLTTREPAAELTALARRFCAPRATFFAPAAPPPGLAAALAERAARAEETPIWVLAPDEGQTAYSLALYAETSGRNWTLTAQLSEAAMAAAGRYERAALARLDAEVAARWFTESDGSPLGDPAEAAAGTAPPAIDLWGDPPAAADTPAAAAGPVLLSPAIRARVGPLALEALPHETLGLIVCDYVLTHAGTQARLDIAARLYDALRPGGTLCLGAGETLSRASGLFEPVPCAGGVIYRKPRHAS